MKDDQSPICYVFTDIEGSTRRWENVPARMRGAVEIHNDILNRAVRKYDGKILSRNGDGIFAIFDQKPLHFAIDVQLKIQKQNWASVGGLAIRIGVHMARRLPINGIDTVAANRAARISDAAWGGQIVLSDEAAIAFPLPDNCNLKSLGKVLLRDLAEPMALSELHHPRLNRSEFPPLRSRLQQAPTLPKPPTPFVGRGGEVEELVNLLSKDVVGPVTIVGPGGNGKTRLLLRVAEMVSRDRQVIFVPLDSAIDEDDISVVIAEALGLPFYGSLSREAQILEYLRTRSALLVLDSAELIADTTSFLSNILNTCPNVKMIASSREPLKMTGESLYRLSGLKVTKGTFDEFRNSEACELFVNSARLVSPKFEIQHHSQKILEKIFDLLDGSPLAIHLAAQWVHLIPLESLRDELLGGLNFLDSSVIVSNGQGGGLRRVFETSWSRLSRYQRDVLARMSVFVGGFDDIAAQDVASGSIEVVGVLESKSLITRNDSGRLTLHPLIRQYANEILNESNEGIAFVKRKHAQYYLSMLRKSFAKFTLKNQGRLLSNLDEDRPNIRAAWSTAVEYRQFDLLWGASEELFYFTVFRSKFVEAISMFERKTGDKELDNYFSGIISNCYVHQGDFDGAELSATCALTCDNPLTVAHAHQALGNLAHLRGNEDAALHHYLTARSIRSQLGDLWGTQYTESSLGALRLAQGRLFDARQHIKNSFEASQQIGNSNGLMVSHLAAGTIADREQRNADARQNYLQGLRIEQDVDCPQTRVTLLLRLAHTLINDGDKLGAINSLTEALDLAVKIGDERQEAKALLSLAASSRDDGEIPNAREFAMDGLILGRKLDSRPIQIKGLLELVKLDVIEGNDGAVDMVLGALDGVELGDYSVEYDSLKTDLNWNDSQGKNDRSIESVVDQKIKERGLNALKL